MNGEGGLVELFRNLLSFFDRLEVEISEIHVSERQYVHRENVFAFVEMNFEKLWRQVPMVPLAPGQRVSRIVCRRDLQRSGCVLSIHVD